MEQLRTIVEEQKANLQSAEKDQRKFKAEQAEYANTLATYQADLQRVRSEAQKFRHDLDELRGERDSLQNKLKDDKTSGERIKVQSQSQIRLLNEQILKLQERVRVAEEQQAGHVCASYVFCYIASFDLTLNRFLVAIRASCSFENSIAKRARG